MKLHHLTLLALAFVIGCDDDTDDGTDTFEPTGDTMDTAIEIVAPRFELTSSDWQDAIVVCTNAETFLLVLEAEGVGFDGELWIADTYDVGQTPSYDEVHDLAKTDANVVEQSSVFEVELVPQEDSTFGNNYERNVSTTFQCRTLDPDRDATVTFAAKINDQDGMVSDCIVFGDKPDEVLAGGFGDLEYPSWLTSGNCRAL